MVARRPVRDLHPEGQPNANVRNGSRGRVVAVSGDREKTTPRVQPESLGIVEVPERFVKPHADKRGRVSPGLDYGYALTSYEADLVALAIG